MSWKRPAAISAGIDMKKLSLVAVTRSRPRNSPTEIVAPERETPGTSATAWARPIRMASVRPRSRSARSCVATRSASHITSAPADQRHRDHPQRAQVAGDEVLGRAARSTPTGMVATMTYQPIRCSSWPRYSDLHQAQGPGPDDVPDVLGEVDDHRGDRAHLDHRGVAGDRRVVDLEAEQLLRDGEVAGAGDRQELGEPLHHAQHDGVEVVHAHWRLRTPAVHPLAGSLREVRRVGRLRFGPCSTGPWVAPASRSRDSAWG